MADLQEVLRAVFRGARKSRPSVPPMTPEQQEEVVGKGAEALGDILLQEEDQLRKRLRRYRTTTITIGI